LCSFTGIIFSISAAVSVIDSLLHICLNSSFCHNVFTLFLMCEKSQFSRWCWCSLHAGIHLPPHEVVGSHDGDRHSIAESTVDVPMRLFRQIFIARTALFSCPSAQSAAYIWSPFDFCEPFGNRKSPCNCHYFLPSCLQGMRRLLKYFPQSALISFSRNMKSTIHVPYAGCIWPGDRYCLALP